MDLTPAVDGKYGAPMGRQSWDDNAEPFAGRMYLRHIPLDSGGYDKGGTYWGIGMRLYGYAAHDDSVNGFVRAYDRVDAKSKVLELHPQATFFS
jgi:hypothetical protein